MDFAVPADSRVKIKKQNKTIDKYLDLAGELKKAPEYVTVIPIVVGALGTVLKSLERGLEQLEIIGGIGTISRLGL